mgnify:CR=1 FL=1
MTLNLAANVLAFSIILKFPCKKCESRVMGGSFISGQNSSVTSVGELHSVLLNQSLSNQ